MATSQLSLSSPFVFIVLEKLLAIYLVGFTAPNSSLRPALFPIFLAWNYSLIPNYTSYVSRIPWIAFVAGGSFTAVWGYVEKLLLSQWSFEDLGPSAEIRGRQISKNEPAPNGKSQEAAHYLSGKKDGIWERLRFGTWTAFSTRYAGSPYQARNVPPYSTSDPSYVPTRRAFLVKKALTFVLCYLVTDILTQGGQPDQNPIIYAPRYVSFFSRLSEVSAQEVVTRVVTSVFIWVGGYLVVHIYYSGMAILTVGSGLDRPELWRPIFGPFSEAYTLRGFWGKFWHQLLRKRLTKPARYITHTILRLPRNRTSSSHLSRLVSRYTELFLVFWMSGLLHQHMEVAQGLTWSESGATWFFIMMAAGIMVEDTAQWVFKGQQGTWWRRAVGYVWVLAWFSWVTPGWSYTGLARNTGGPEHQLLPFSVLRWAGGKA